jgi:hypothetical protein
MPVNAGTDTVDAGADVFNAAADATLKPALSISAWATLDERLVRDPERAPLLHWFHCANSSLILIHGIVLARKLLT